MPLNLKPGDAFPDFALPDQTGGKVTLEQVAGGKPLFLVFYRGYW